MGRLRPMPRPSTHHISYYDTGCPKRVTITYSTAVQVRYGNKKETNKTKAPTSVALRARSSSLLTLSRNSSAARSWRAWPDRANSEVSVNGLSLGTGMNPVDCGGTGRARTLWAAASYSFVPSYYMKTSKKERKQFQRQTRAEQEWPIEKSEYKIE